MEIFKGIFTENEIYATKIKSNSNKKYIIIGQIINMKKKTEK
jgi:hypothetical protein